MSENIVLILMIGMLDNVSSILCLLCFFILIMDDLYQFVHAISGSEAMFADLGHFSFRAIQVLLSVMFKLSVSSSIFHCRSW